MKLLTKKPRLAKQIILLLMFVGVLLLLFFTNIQEAAPAEVTVTEFSDFQSPIAKVLQAWSSNCGEATATE